NSSTATLGSSAPQSSSSGSGETKKPTYDMKKIMMEGWDFPRPISLIPFILDKNYLANMHLFVSVTAHIESMAYSQTVKNAMAIGKKPKDDGKVKLIEEDPATRVTRQIVGMSTGNRI